MCHTACIDFAKNNIKKKDVAGDCVLEVGSLYINGSVRSIIEELGPASYVGVDLQSGPGVDEVCDAGDLVDRFGQYTFDLVISTELLEHVRDWRRVISNLKNVLRPGGTIVITTRSEGFGYHGFPYDFWRFDVSDMEAMFSDFEIEKLEKDPEYPGVMMKAIKPVEYSENDLTGHKLYSILKRRRMTDISNLEVIICNTPHFVRHWTRRILKHALPEPIKKIIREKILHE
jgi:SAM-dependent methyltransferase